MDFNLFLHTKEDISSFHFPRYLRNILILWAVMHSHDSMELGKAMSRGIREEKPQDSTGPRTVDVVPSARSPSSLQQVQGGFII